jgi:hypothetical protein
VFSRSLQPWHELEVLQPDGAAISTHRLAHVPLIATLIRERFPEKDLAQALRLGDKMWTSSECRFKAEEQLSLKAQIDWLVTAAGGDEWPVFTIDLSETIYLQRDFCLRPDGSVAWTIGSPPLWEISPKRDGSMRAFAGKSSITGACLTGAWQDVFTLRNESGESLPVPGVSDRLFEVEARDFSIRVAGSMQPLESLLIPELVAISQACTMALAAGCEILVSAD